MVYNDLKIYRFQSGYFPIKANQCGGNGAVNVTK